MHWTLQLLVSLTLLCLFGNAVQFAMSGSVRMSGLLLCSAWVVQQTFWWVAGTDSLMLFLLGDLALLVWFYRHASGVSESIAGWVVLPTVGLAVFQHLNDGHTPFSWWLNFWLIVMQFVLCMPRPKSQLALNCFSHGRLRPNLEA